MATCLSRVILVCTVASILHTQARVARRFAPHFEDAVQVATIQSKEIDEASGICASRIHPGVLYTHNDHGDTHRIFAINATNGATIAIISIHHASSHDWEDIACGPCPGGNGKYCVFIADTGGSTGTASNTIYRIVEPSHLSSSMSVNLDSKLQFSWSEHDCETLMVDPSGEIYVISKEHGGRGKLVHLPSSAWGSSHRVSVNDGIHLDLNTQTNDPVGGDISPTGYEVLIKTQGAINYYQVPDHKYLDHLGGSPTHIHYHQEHQGESVGWDAHASGFYTLGEGKHEPLYYYKRTVQNPVIG